MLTFYCALIDRAHRSWLCFRACIGFRHTCMRCECVQKNHTVWCATYIVHVCHDPVHFWGSFTNPVPPPPPRTFGCSWAEWTCTVKRGLTVQSCEHDTMPLRCMVLWRRLKGIDEKGEYRGVSDPSEEPGPWKTRSKSMNTHGMETMMSPWLWQDTYLALMPTWLPLMLKEGDVSMGDCSELEEQLLDVLMPHDVDGSCAMLHEDWSTSISMASVLWLLASCVTVVPVDEANIWSGCAVWRRLSLFMVPPACGTWVAGSDGTSAWVHVPRGSPTSWPLIASRFVWTCASPSCTTPGPAALHPSPKVRF